ncbi:hypothetical protein KAU11_07130, partial [Candidatus Babeliales bacterium]|nr:hypothetical protein [Candidatus Babeliales bacterium]
KQDIGLANIALWLVGQRKSFLPKSFSFWSKFFSQPGEVPMRGLAIQTPVGGGPTYDESMSSINSLSNMSHHYFDM